MSEVYSYGFGYLDWWCQTLLLLLSLPFYSVLLTIFSVRSPLVHFTKRRQWHQPKVHWHFTHTLSFLLSHSFLLAHTISLSILKIYEMVFGANSFCYNAIPVVIRIKVWVYYAEWRYVIHYGHKAGYICFFLLRGNRMNENCWYFFFQQFSRFLYIFTVFFTCISFIWFIKFSFFSGVYYCLFLFFLVHVCWFNLGFTSSISIHNLFVT